MKIDEILYEGLDCISEQETQQLEDMLLKGSPYSIESKKMLKRQEKLTMDKIGLEMRNEKQTALPIFQLHRLGSFVAVFVLMIGIAVYAKENDWDIEMAERIGLAGVMEELENGYVRINQSATQDGITVMASQSIGDQNSQWIQIDTTIPWNVSEDGYYMFDEMDIRFNKDNGRIITGGGVSYSFDNNGYVSFMFCEKGYEKINRANVEITLGKLRKYSTAEEEEGELVNDAVWQLSWKNCYAANTITKRICTVANDCLVYKIELSPISVRVEAAGSIHPEDNSLLVNSITLKDGTVISCVEESAGYGNVFMETYATYSDYSKVQLEEIASVMINGKEISID